MYCNWPRGSQEVSVNLYCSINLPDEGVCCVEPYRACEQPEGDHHDGGVGEIQQGGHELVYLQLGAEIEHTVGGYINCTSSRDGERSMERINTLKLFKLEL